MRRGSNILLIMAIVLFVVFILAANETYGQGIGQMGYEPVVVEPTAVYFNGPAQVTAHPFATCWETGWGLQRCTL